MAGDVIFALLANETAAGSRIYPLLLPQSPTYPAVTYQQVASTPTHLFSGDAPLVRVRMQVDMWGESYADVRQLATDVRSKLSRVRGEIAGHTVFDILSDSEMEMYEDETMTRRVSQDYTILLGS